MKDFADDAILGHQVYPLLGGIRVEVGQPRSLPLVTVQGPPSAFAVGTLEPEPACDHRVSECAAPRGDAAAIAHGTYFDHVQGHRSVEHRHVADSQP